MPPFINASSIVNAASNCDGVVCSVGLASLVPGLISRIVNAVAFNPPKPPGYHITDDKQVFIVGPGYSLEPLPDYTSEGITINTVKMWTRRRNTIHGFHIRRADAMATLLFSHANAADIGTMFNHLIEICRECRVDVLAYEFTGYGESSGTPSEADMYADIDAAYHYLVQDAAVPENLIFLCGQSIGSAPTLDLAARRQVGGIILHSPLRSGVSLVHDVKQMYWFDMFKNLEKIEDVRAPVFIMHGTHDLDVPFEHAQALFSACPPEFAAEPWWVKDAGHNDIEIMHKQMYFARVLEFIETCLWPKRTGEMIR